LGFAAVARAVQTHPVLLVALAFALSVAAAVRAAPQSLGEQAEVQPSCPSAGAVSARFVAAVSAASFRTSDGKEIRLAGVIGSTEDGEPSSPAEVIAARAALGLALSGHQVSLAIIGPPDRYQRVAAHVFADRIWVQDTMLRQGLLRLGPDRPAGGCTAAMLIAEDSAISGKIGHWGDGLYRVKTPDQVTKSAGRFETVDGEVWRVRLIKGRETIEFANASSFQLIILPQATRALRSRGIDVRRLRGRTVRTRPGAIAPGRELSG
jgi:endonuclease YncB( thermonuclease family)